ncbi:hypothetical protein SLEP1_g3720 [Rubroshorea leprosula]|uniref:Uncharacterized protein n=1 Tax=Rubroshorea leprosula TaxID=152421 RepID=A0AAV5HV51_9ROSI|nr:hypothetical protein SLEP1_g3720 [Rubroshorea leprosula]
MDKIQQLIDEISGLEELSTYQNLVAAELGLAGGRSRRQFYKGLTELT